MRCEMWKPKLETRNSPAFAGATAGKQLATRNPTLLA